MPKKKDDKDRSNSAKSADEVAAERLHHFVSRVENLEDEKKALMDDIKEVYSEAKGEGYDTKIMRAVIRRRRMEAAERQEMDALLELYEKALDKEFV